MKELFTEISDEKIKEIKAWIKSRYDERHTILYHLRESQGIFIDDVCGLISEYASIISKEKDEEIKRLQDAIIYLHNKLYILRHSKNAVSKYVDRDCQKAYDRACEEVLLISNSIAQQALKPEP